MARANIRASRSRRLTDRNRRRTDRTCSLQRSIASPVYAPQGAGNSDDGPVCSRLRSSSPGAIAYRYFPRSPRPKDRSHDDHQSTTPLLAASVTEIINCPKPSQMRVTFAACAGLACNRFFLTSAVRSPQFDRATQTGNDIGNRNPHIEVSPHGGNEAGDVRKFPGILQVVQCSTICDGATPDAGASEKR